MSKEVLQLIRIGFDNMENRDAVVTSVIGVFGDDDAPSVTARAKIDVKLLEEKAQQPYLGWDGKIYPQYKIVKISVQ